MHVPDNVDRMYVLTSFIALLVFKVIPLVSRCTNGRGLNAVLLLAGHLVVEYPSLEYLVLSHPRLLLLLDTDFPMLTSYPVCRASTCLLLPLLHLLLLLLLLLLLCHSTIIVEAWYQLS